MDRYDNSTDALAQDLWGKLFPDHPWCDATADQRDACRDVVLQAATLRDPTLDAASPLGETPVGEEPTPWADLAHSNVARGHADRVAAGKAQEAARTHPDATPSNATKETAHGLFRSLHELLRGYEAHHLSKAGPLWAIVHADVSTESVQAAEAQIADTQAKARRNGDMASRIERWLEANPPLHSSVESWLRQQVPMIFDANRSEAVPPREQWPPEMVAEFALVEDMVVAMLAPLYAMVGDAQEAGVIGAQDARNGMLACDIVAQLLGHFQRQAREALAQPVTVQ